MLWFMPRNMQLPHSLDYNWPGNYQITSNRFEIHLIWDACIVWIWPLLSSSNSKMNPCTSSDDVLCTISMPVVCIHNQILHQFKRNRRFIRISTRLCLFWQNWCPVHSWPPRIAAVRPLFAFFSCAIPPTSMTTPRTFNAVVWSICYSLGR